MGRMKGSPPKHLRAAEIHLEQLQAESELEEAELQPGSEKLKKSNWFS